MSGLFSPRCLFAGTACPAASVGLAGRVVCAGAHSVHRAHLRSSACHSTRSDFKHRAMSVRTAAWAHVKSSSDIRLSPGSDAALHAPGFAAWGAFSS